MDVCKTDDPNLNDCILRRLNLAFPNYAKGLPQYGIPPFDPFKFTNVQFKTEIGNIIKLTTNFVQVLFKGFKNSIIEKAT